MKIYSLAIPLIVAILVVFYFVFPKSNIATDRVSEISFTESQISFGVIKQGIPQKAVFTFANTGAYPLLIQNVETSCGCTVPEWTKKPVKPGESGQITVTYDAKYPGRFHKTITVFANVEDSPVQLNISGEVGFSDQLTVISDQ